ncbi:hypothetical protein [Streptococcus oralis]|uniref:Uncharacterized protein n=1 Tax=Streptococcus oralis subsp. oralis TaxID=1891914 RepID=A0A1X1GV00_STROR|nr:hypothetical protein [Streptococcus oralis]ORO50534.1 hypothetical protein B7723_00485 [Streptococcus oralis subsp. oralis]ORO69205.1 hypothetical protein B7713_00450 [Streptococcus oralis subsp. oralis]ORO74443.1 hypothetical protein B7712_00555 [Streptococcus oralis subsp. oralis]
MTSNIVTKWQNTAAIIDLNSPLQQIFKSNQIGLNKNDGYYIYNKENTWIFEEEFINAPSHNLQQIFDKLCIKNYDNIQYFDSVTSEFKVVTESDAENYLKIISFNTINGVEYDKLKISLKLLSGGDYSSKSDRVRHLINIYVLLLLANRTKRQQNRLEFTFEGDLDSFVFKTEFGKQNSIDGSLEIDGLLEIYEWIVTEQEYSEAYKVKLQIVRSLILKQKKLDGLDLIKNQAESIFNRIVSGKTDHYFELQNNLKDDFIKISTMISESNSSLNTKLFGWLTAFSLIIFDFIKKSDGQSIFGRIVCSTSEKTNVLLLLLIMALLIIMIMFNLDIRNIRKRYQCLKDLYVSQMFISEEEFNKFIKKPLYRNMYNLLLLSLLIILVIRLLIPMKYGCF